MYTQFPMTEPVVASWRRRRSRLRKASASDRSDSAVRGVRRGNSFFRSSLCYHITSVGRFQSAPTSSGQIGEEPPGNLGKGIHMSDVEKKEDFEGHKKGHRG